MVSTSIPVVIVRVPKYRVLPAETRIRGDNQLAGVSVGANGNGRYRGIVGRCRGIWHCEVADCRRWVWRVRYYVR